MKRSNIIVKIKHGSRKFSLFVNMKLLWLKPETIHANRWFIGVHKSNSKIQIQLENCVVAMWWICEFITRKLHAETITPNNLITSNSRIKRSFVKGARSHYLTITITIAYLKNERCTWWRCVCVCTVHSKSSDMLKRMLFMKCCA